MLKNIGSNVVTASRSSTGKKAQVVASFGTATSASTGSGSMVARGSQNGIYDRDILDGFVAYRDHAAIRRIARDIFDFDPISGSAVEMLSKLPFSQFELSGVPDHKMLNVYSENLNSMDIASSAPEIAQNHMVDGEFVGSIAKDSESKLLTGIIPIDIDACEFVNLPIPNKDPIIDVLIPSALKELIRSKDERVKQALEKYGNSLEEMSRSNKFKLDPTYTIYYPRRTLATVHRGTSYFKRIIPVWLVEKALMKGTIDLAHRRQRSLLHLMVGDEEFLPSEEQLGQYTDLFRRADADPLGAIVATRPQVQTNELRCLSGDTLIHTDKGLIRIDKLVKHDLDHMQVGSLNVDINVKSIDGSWVKADKWHYQGVKPTVNIYTESNAKLNCTENHKIMTLKVGGLLDLAKPQNIGDDYICIDTKGNQGNKELPLHFDIPDVYERKDNKQIKYQDYMDVDLAYMIGLIVSEGYMNKLSIQVANTDMELLNKFCEASVRVFNKNPKINNKRKSFIKTKVYKTKQCYSANISSTGIVNYLEQLGVKRSVRKSKSPAYYKEIPWSIMQADSKSKYAFLAAYIDADGTITNQSNEINKAVEIKIFSCSNKILNSIKVMLMDMGYLSTVDYKLHRICLNTANSSKLYNEIFKYLVDRKKCVEICGQPKQHKFGIPADIFVSIINQRFIARQSLCSLHKAGSWFMNDEGKEVLVEGDVGNTFRHYKTSKSMFLYSEYKENKYFKELNFIKQISRKLYDNLLVLFSLELKFEKIRKITEGKTQHVYDISIKEGTAPVFVANGMLVKNSGSDFWRVDESGDWFVQQKMRGLGITEGVISGDMTVDTTSNAMTIFLDNLRYFRENWTRKILYHKILLIIAVENDFKVSHREEVTSGFSEETTALIHANSPVIALNNETHRLSDYHLPKVQWHKALKPEGNNELMQNLQTLSTNGLPIPLRIWAVAAGISIPELLRMTEEDVSLRKKLATYKQKWPVDPAAQAQQLMQSNLGPEQVISNLMTKQKRKKNRDLTQWRMVDDLTGKELSKKGQDYRNERANRVIAEATSRLNIVHNAKVKSARPTTRKTHYFSKPYGLIDIRGIA